MKIAETLGCSPREVLQMPYQEITEWEMYFHDIAKMSSQDFIEAREKKGIEIPLDQLSSAGNVRKQ